MRVFVSAVAARRLRAMEVGSTPAGDLFQGLSVTGGDYRLTGERVAFFWTDGASCRQPFEPVGELRFNRLYS